MELKEQRHFFVMLRELHKNLPPSFTSKINQSKFYRYIQDEREKQGSDNSHLKDIVDAKHFYKEFFGFIYVNVFGHYYDLDDIEKLKYKFELKFKKLLQ